MNPRRLSKHARAALLRLRSGMAPVTAFYPGILTKLVGDKLAEVVELPAPDRWPQGRAVDYVRLTPAGQEAARRLAA